MPCTHTTPFTGSSALPSLSLFRLCLRQCTLLSIKTGGCPETCTYCSQSSSWRKDTGLKAEKLLDVDAVVGGGRVHFPRAAARPRDRAACSTIPPRHATVRARSACLAFPSFFSFPLSHAHHGSWLKETVVRATGRSKVPDDPPAMIADWLIPHLSPSPPIYVSPPSSMQWTRPPGLVDGHHHTTICCGSAIGE